jgi:hypothetical protein
MQLGGESRGFTCCEASSRTTSFGCTNAPYSRWYECTQSGVSAKMRRIIGLGASATRPPAELRGFTCCEASSRTTSFGCTNAPYLRWYGCTQSGVSAKMRRIIGLGTPDLCLNQRPQNPSHTFQQVSPVTHLEIRCPSGLELRLEPLV